MDFKILSDHGIDWKKGIARCMDDASFYKHLLELFLLDDSFARGDEAYKNKDHTELFNCMHELKGVCGNIDITGLYKKVDQIVEFLRVGGRTDEEIKPMMEAVRSEYARAFNGIQKALDAE